MAYLGFLFLFESVKYFESSKSLLLFFIVLAQSCHSTPSSSVSRCKSMAFFISDIANIRLPVTR
jgi:hypothetical protein